MPSIEVLGAGVVYRNPMPHLHSRHAYFPSLVQLPGGELLCAMDIGSAFEAVDIRSYVCRSSDGGKTWSEPQTIFKPDESAHPVSTTCRIDLLKVGLEYYRRHTALQTAWAKHFWKVDGLAFNEGMGIYGADWAPNPEGHGGRARLAYHKVSGMEFALMMLEAGSYGGADVRPYLPIALGYLKYHDQFYRAETKKRTGRELDDQGRLVIFPGNAIEMYQGTRNDTSTISGLMALSKAVLELPEDVLPADQRAFCESFRKTLPPLPT